MTELYPLRFKPIFHYYLWGGRSLQSVLGKSIDEDTCAESWEIAAHGDDQSRVAFGELAGKKLGKLCRDRRKELLGGSECDSFPLLFKFLDARLKLSLQVHPNDALAARRRPPDRGKTEAWVVLDAAPGAVVYAGLKQGVKQETFENVLRTAAGTGLLPVLRRLLRRFSSLPRPEIELESLLHRFEVQAGDCIFLPAGVCHAIGEGLLIAEIQQSSDTTYRLYDWNRRGANGKYRTLHIDDGLEAMDFSIGPVEPCVSTATDQPHVERLVDCDKFVLDRWRFADPRPVAGDGRFHILSVLEGEVMVEGDPTDRPLCKGDTILLPASLPSTILTPAQPTVLLDMYLPSV